MSFNAPVILKELKEFCETTVTAGEKSVCLERQIMEMLITQSWWTEIMRGKKMYFLTEILEETTVAK